MTEVNACKPALTLKDDDQVAYVLVEVAVLDHIRLQGRSEMSSFQATGNIPQFHKVALVAIKKGMKVKRDGYVIGCASTDISVGDWVHTHNLSSTRAFQQPAPDKL